MQLDEVALERLEERWERELAELSPEACLATAEMLRDVKPKLRTQRQCEIAEEVAQEFEAQAAAQKPA